MPNQTRRVYVKWPGSKSTKCADSLFNDSAAVRPKIRAVKLEKLPSSAKFPVSSY